MPEIFDGPALAAATRLAEAGDELLTDALTRTRDHGRVTQDLAGAPALLDRYNNAGTGGKALLEAAMDARRLDVGLHLPQAFPTDAATVYLCDTDYDHLTGDWAEQAYAEVAEPVHGKQAPLRRTNTRPPRNPAAPAPPPALLPPSRDRCCVSPTTSKSTTAPTAAASAHPPPLARRPHPSHSTSTPSPAQPSSATAFDGPATSAYAPPHTAPKPTS
ncbi:hypothetical protein ACFC3O_33945 [Streptomyces sp. NPDC056007]|uniref:hypothetical protein n=1 Tax=unclassified Streptomyces TaxID=2593676 RepID=UPI0035E08A5D